MRRRGYTLVELFVLIGVLVVVCFFIWKGIGLLWKGEDFAGLKGNIGGKWELKRSEYNWKTLEFTSGGSVIRKQWLDSDGVIGKYEFKDSVLVLSVGNEATAIYGVEFVSDIEMLLRPESVKRDDRNFGHLDGRWKRIAGPTTVTPAPASPTASSLTDAEQRVAKYETKRAALEPLLEKAQADRAELVEKLRAAGVNSPADLKGNPTGQQLAGSLQRLSAEIDGLERQVAALDSAVLDAKAVVRRMEREKAGISGDELQNLTEQLREAEEKADGAAKQPLTPLDLDATLRKALSTKQAPAKAPKSSSGSRFPIKINEVLTSSERTKWFEVRFQKGKTYRIDLKSNQFDSHLFLRIRGSIIEQSDDSGRNRNAQIVYRSSESGSYEVEATSVKRGGTGAFSLEIREE